MDRQTGMGMIIPRDQVLGWMLPEPKHDQDRMLSVQFWFTTLFLPLLCRVASRNVVVQFLLTIFNKAQTKQQQQHDQQQQQHDQQQQYRQYGTQHDRSIH